MQFILSSVYNRSSMTEMAKVLRKTVRRKHSRRSHIFGVIVMLLGLLLLLKNFAMDIRTAVNVTAILAILLAMLFEDRLNGYFAEKRLLVGTENAVTVFTETGFASETTVGKTEWNYDMIAVIAETKDRFVFVFSANHAQLYDKRSIEGGTPEEFAAFLEMLTEKKIIKV